VLLGQFKADRQGTETFADYCQRIGSAGLVEMLPPELRTGKKTAAAH
jgi:hypothetical protein